MGATSISMARCPFCASSPLRLKWRKAGYLFVECEACGLVVLDPIPTSEAIARYYEEEFFAGGEAGYVDYEREQRWRRKNYLRDIRVLESLQSPGRLLDVGCAMGQFLNALSPSWDKHGLEVSRYAGLEAQKVFGAERIQIAPVRDAVYEKDSFDAVTLWETINHMVDPLGDLACIHRWMKPGGILAISVGDMSSLLARAMGKYWYHVTPPVHIWYLRRRTLVAWLDRCGFDIARIHYPGKYVDVSTSLERIRETTGSTLLTRVCRGLARLPWASLTLYINLRDTMYVYARKR